MHTRHSDGSGTVDELAQAAYEAGLRWIIITDHDTLAG
ncbi:MAG TPA: PHP domain-containing protein, partial [Roseiflexaceae bacterium]|nr:PHP domain-containing protein [Roseiflexaceae bacterium]